MGHGNVKIALTAIRRSRWRSLLTMFGVIVGIVSVVTVASFGEGVKRQVTKQIKGFGSDLITIRPGKVVNRDNKGHISSVNILTSLTANTLTDEDLIVIRRTVGVRTSVPFGLVSGLAQSGNQQATNSSIVATTPDAPSLITQKVQYGSFFGHGDEDKGVAVIGPQIAAQLFQENAPIGQTLTIRDQEYVVRGVFQPSPSALLSLTPDVNRVIMIPYDNARSLSKSPLQITQVLVRPSDPSQVKAVAARLNQALLRTHGNQNDFTVLLPNEALAATSSAFTMLTTLVAGIASISLIVGGIGIMNIMLVSVTERTKEIGIRKAVGATNRQILSQFLIEAMVLSVSGGVVGIMLALLVNYLLIIFTSLSPVLTLPIIFIATAISVLVGVVFGVIPAVKAARLDPIDALRYE